MRHTTRIITHLAVASLAMTTLSGCLAAAVETAVATVIANQLTHKINEVLSDTPSTESSSNGVADTAGGRHHGNSGNSSGNGSNTPIYARPGKFSPSIYAGGVYGSITFPRGFDGGVVDVPDKSMNVLRNFQQKSLSLVNAERSKAGRHALRLDDGLNAYALVRSMETTGTFSHTRPNGVDALDYITSDHAAENIAMNWNGSPESLVDQWMHSQGHRNNILSPKVKTMGIGLAVKGRSFYSAQLFAGEQVKTPYRFK